ncbi:MAG: pilus assembly protein PilX [Ruminococcus sp.]|nr:pilus assembly protein PilX [Ruminococcus sp.]
MRKINAIITMLIIVLFLFHGIAGGFQLAGVINGGSKLMKTLAHIMEALIWLHVLIGIKLTADTVKAMKRAGVSYFKENKLFWLRRISGLAVMVFIMAHIFIFAHNGEGAYRLNEFGGFELMTQILLVVSIALHAVSNAKPALISFGIKSFKEAGLDLALILAGILIFTGIAFIIYYFRWAAV